jgi:hypothetical protein
MQSQPTAERELCGLQLHAAVAAADTQLATEVLLLDRAYCDHYSSRESLLVQQDSSGRTPLHECAAMYASSDVLALWERLLVECYSPKSQLTLDKQDCCGSTVLHALIQHQQLSMLQRFLQTCNTLDYLTALLAIEDEHGANSVVLAQRLGHDMVSRLLGQYCSEVGQFLAEVSAVVRMLSLRKHQSSSA